jgi:plasmid stability protein
VLRRLKGRAAARPKSLEQSLRDILTDAAAPGPAELFALVQRIRAMTPVHAGGAQFPTAEAMIRERSPNASRPG